MDRITGKALVKNIERRAVNQRLSAIESRVTGGDSDYGKMFAEAYSDFAKSLLALEDQGWKNLFGGKNPFEDQDGFSLDERQKLAQYAREQTTKSPLLKRGRAFRANNVFGRGAPIEGTVAPRFQQLIDDPVNQDALFSIEAQVNNDGVLFTDGTFLTVWDKIDKQWEIVPLSEITDVWRNPRRPSQIWYYLREYSYEIFSSTGKTDKIEYKKWIRLDTHAAPANEPTKLSDIEIDKNAVMVDLPVNRESSKQRLGLPDCLPALYWDKLYSEAMLDKAKLNRALSTIAWLVKQRSAKGTANAGAKIASQTRGVGKTAVATEGTELTSMPRAGSIDFNELRPLASMVATSLEVSTVAILSDSGAASGSNAAESTLDQPTAKSAETRQELWKDFYKRAFRVMGIPEDKIPKINFPKISPDPTHRYIQSLNLVDERGGLHDDEYRLASLEALDIIPLRSAIPASRKGVVAPKTSTTPGQGQNGTVGELSDGDNELRDQNL